MFDYCEWLRGKPKTVITFDFGTRKLRFLHPFQIAICIRIHLPTYSLINIHIRSLQFRQINSSEKFAVASPMA